MGRRGAGVLITSAGRELGRDELAAAVARARASLPGGRGRGIAVAVKDAPGALIAALAVLESGACLAPLDTRAATGGLVARARPAVTIDAATLEGSLTLREEPDPRVVPDEAGLLLFTSGSTGEPKGVLLRRSGIDANVEAILGYLPVRAFPRTAVVLPLVYSYALVGQVLVTLRAGGTVILLNEVPYPMRQIELMVRHRASGLSSVATSLRLLARAAAEAPERPELGYVASAGGPLDVATRELVREVWPRARLWNQYGLTEASPRVTAISDVEEPFWRGSVGRPLPGLEVESDGGELLVRGPSIMMGYLDRPDDTARVLGPRGLRTGDLGRVDEAGYVWIEGRRDGVVKCAGERVSVLEVGEVLRGAAGVADVCVVAVPDELQGARLVAFLEGDAGALAAARRVAREQLAPAKRPSRFIVLPALPRLPGGKVALAELQKVAAEP